MRYYQFFDNTDQNMGMVVCPQKVTPEMVSSELRKFGNNVDAFFEQNTLGAVHVIVADIQVPEEFNIENHED